MNFFIGMPDYYNGDQEGENVRRGEGEQQGEQAGDQGITHDHTKVVLEEIRKPLEAHKRSVEQIVEIAVTGGAVVGKSHVQAGHGRITDQDYPNQSRNHQQKQIALIPEPPR